MGGGGLAPHANAVRHQQLPYENDDDFVAGTWQFVQDGLAADDAILVLLPLRRQRLLKSALGSLARRVQFSNMEAAGRNPNLIISIWRDFVDYNVRLGRGVRGIGEPAYGGRRPAEYDEVVLHEALCNVAFNHGPRGRCCVLTEPAKWRPRFSMLDALPIRRSGTMRARNRTTTTSAPSTQKPSCERSCRRQTPRRFPFPSRTSGRSERRWPRSR